MSTPAVTGESRLRGRSMPLLIWALGMAAYLATHLLWLGRVAGFHYDEAWAAWFSHQIATERGFWPIQAMSPYTSAWSHYLAALLFRLLGTSLFTYRASGVLLTTLGLAGMSLALRRVGEARAACLLPWVLAFFPALVMNERFCVEITTFQVFCFGLLCLGLAERQAAITPARRLASDLLIALATLLGITSHVLFIAPALGAWIAFLPRGMRFSQRLVLFGLFGALLAFFLRVHSQIPEKGKSLSLLVLTLALILYCLAPAGLERRLFRAAQSAKGRAAVRLFELALRILCVPASFFLLFFAEGSWSSLFFSSRLPAPWLIGALGFAPLLALWLWWKRRPRPGAGAPTLNRRALQWLQLTLVITTLIAVKPAPRYFEIPLLMLGALLALLFSRLASRPAKLCLGVWLLVGALQLGFNYLAPGLRGIVDERSYRFLFFRDGTSDTLQKQLLARELARSGCRFDQIRSDDPRLLAPLRFLSLADWEIPAGSPSSCRFGDRVWVSRKSEMHHSASVGAVEELGPFVITGLSAATFQTKP